MIRRIQFRVRGLLLALTCVSVLLGFHWNINRLANRQASIVRRINDVNDVGPGVVYNFGYSSVGGKCDAVIDTESAFTTTFFGRLSVPEFLIDRLGVDYFCQVKAVSLPGRAESQTAEFDSWRADVESVIRDLHQLRGLEELALPTTGIRPEALDGMSRLRKLRKVVIQDNAPTAAHLERLAGSSMTELGLFGHVSDEQLMAIGRATQLMVLDMGALAMQESEISDIGIAAICELPNLRSLSICSHTLSSGGLEDLSKLVTLTELRIRAPGIEGLRKAIYAMPLRSLYVLDMELNDQDLQAIGRLDCLEELYIGYTTSTPAIPIVQLRELVRSSSLRRFELDGLLVTVGEVRELANTNSRLDMLAVNSPLISLSDATELAKEYDPSPTMICQPLTR